MVSGIMSKVLSIAGVDFNAKWDADGYMKFLKDNGFTAVYSKQLPSTIPLLYAECNLKEKT